MEQLFAIFLLLKPQSNLSLKISLIFRIDNLSFAIISSSIKIEKDIGFKSKIIQRRYDFKVAGIKRNGWPICSGIGGRFVPE